MSGVGLHLDVNSPSYDGFLWEKPSTPFDLFIKDPQRLVIISVDYAFLTRSVLRDCSDRPRIIKKLRRALLGYSLYTTLSVLAYPKHVADPRTRCPRPALINESS